MPTNEDAINRFVGSNQVIKDLRSVFSEGPVQTANELKTHIGRESVCDFNAQIVSSLYDPTETSLQHVIRTSVRDDQGDDTELKAARRLYLNAKSAQQLTSQTAITRTGVQLNYPLPIAYERSMVEHLATKPKCYVREGNTITFTRPARIQINAKMNWGIWSGVDRLDSPTVEPSWRFGSGGNNRNVNISLSLFLTGALTGGALTGKILTQTTMFYEEEVNPPQTRQLISTIVLDVAQATSNRGRIDSIKFEMERSPFVISYGARTDHAGLFKTTNTGVEDDTNYIEIIEL